MANFLQLCQSVARESGTVSGNNPATATNQSGRLLKVVQYTAEAWRQIQMKRRDWNFMLREWTGVTLEGNDAYTAASFNITDLSGWDQVSSISLLPVGSPVGERSKIYYVPWADFRENLRDAYSFAGRPGYWSVRPFDGALVVAPKPDGEYTLSGQYTKKAQMLSSDTDTPALHEDYHDAIVWKGVQLLHEHDEAYNPAAQAERQFNVIYNNMLSRETPRITIGEPLA